MIRKIDPNERTVLKFPAVRPCESISPSTLITSLINLCQTIEIYHSKSFPTHRRIIREAIRQVEILLIFFEEVRDNETSHTQSLKLCLSELHFSLQKVLFLIQDCSRQGSRLYMLMKSRFVVNHFGVLIRSFGSSLDVLELSSLKINTEVKELVDLLTKQAQKAKLEMGMNDQYVMERVLLILDQFDNGFEPEKGIVKRVLDYLSVRTWNECNNEVKFLENEINNVEDDEREFVLVSNLLGFMCYCRGVMFETLDEIDHLVNEPESSSNDEMLSCLNPEDFRCPISLELMIDPVTVSTGQTYDRSSIFKWLRAGNSLCPKTGEKLTSTELVPNTSLKKLIYKFCQDKGISISRSSKRNRDLSKTIVSPSPASREAMRFLAQFLAARLSYGSDDQKNKAAYEIRLLTKSNVFNRSILIQVGNVAPLLDLLTSTDADTQENAIAALLKLSKHTKGQKAIVEEGGLMLLISVLRRGIKFESRQIAAATMFYLSSVDKYRRLIGSTREAIPALIELIKDGSVYGKKNALAAIFGLLLYHGNHERALECGIVPILVDLIASNERSDLLEDSLAVLASLADSIDGSIAILQTSALSMIIGLVKSSSLARTGVEFCVSVLHSLCINGGDEVIASLAKEPSLMPPLYSLVTDGSSHASKRSRMLINMLQKFHESSSSNLVAASAIRKERILRAI